MSRGETQVGRVALRAYEIAVAGLDPLEAWRTTLRETYAGDQLKNQVRHSCPKWAFSILCHEGQLMGVERGCCPQASNSSSGEYTLSALKQLRGNPSLAHERAQLKRQVFGKRGDANYRTPNGEVEVLVSLWNADLVRKD